MQHSSRAASGAYFHEYEPCLNTQTVEIYRALVSFHSVAPEESPCFSHDRRFRTITAFAKCSAQKIFRIEIALMLWELLPFLDYTFIGLTWLRSDSFQPEPRPLLYTLSTIQLVVTP
jgi:hypothetical protein